MNISAEGGSRTICGRDSHVSTKMALLYIPAYLTVGCGQMTAF